MSRKSKQDETIRTAAEIALEKAGHEEVDDMPETPEEPAPNPAPDPEEESFREKYLRVRADLENIQRRQREERDSMRAQAVVSLLRELLPSFDSLDRALQAAQDDDSDLAQGLRMTCQQLEASLAANNVSRIDNDGLFDADRHEAITTVEDPSVPAGTIRAVIEPGYVLDGRVIRYSKVQVTTGGPEPEQQDKE